jgi:signal transduction histidine kinase
VAGLLVALGLSLWMSKRISRPLSELTVAATSIAGGEYGEQVDAGGGRETEELGRAFNLLSEKLEKNEMLRKNMVADIAHELRTPLTTLRVEFEAVKDGLLKPDPAVMDNLLGDIRVLTRLVEDLQELSLAEAGQLKLELAEVDAEEVIDEVVARFDNEFAGKGVYLKTRVDDGLPPISADRLRLAQVLGNLVKNSLTYTPEGGSVSVRALRSGPQVTISVADTGAGITHDELPFIFERFCRVDRSRARKTGGSGLGLTIAKSIVTAHGGRIWAESEVGKGTDIFFTVPIA